MCHTGTREWDALECYVKSKSSVSLPSSQLAEAKFRSEDHRIGKVEGTIVPSGPNTLKKQGHPRAHKISLYL